MQARRGNNLINQEMAIIEMTHFESKVWTRNKSNSYKTKYFFHLFNENNKYYKHSTNSNRGDQYILELKRLSLRSQSHALALYVQVQCPLE